MRNAVYCGIRVGAIMVVFVSLVLLGIADRAEAEMRKFTLINVLLDGTKIWLPSVLIVYEGDEVELTLINKLDEPHGFKIATVGVEAVVEPKATTTVRFTAKKEVIDSFVCHLHPPHIGGQLLVIEK